ncbi:molybdenum cofactor guanylyltransferase [Anoxybacillus sp. B7M1]|uniref:molybdenum cofactor guanylyltransferase n=1 Tax=unclassified Anoxybacillus TaxID=2639704 RepID=UPI001E2D2619|nr:MULTISPECIES: molybdenum cofactor guanylyltransferase [unclassified Anoxybacillus]
MERMIGAVLAGGQSRRFGSPKAFAKRKNQYFFQIAVDALHPFVKEVYIVSHPDLVARFERMVTNEKVVMDEERYRGQGPLAGIYTVMKQTEADWIFVLPCDMPYMQSDTVGRMVSYVDCAFDIVVSTHFGRLQPLVGAYHRRTMKWIEHMLQHGDNRMRSLFEHCSVRYVNEQDFGAEEIVFRNVNDLDEYADIAAE